MDPITYVMQSEHDQVNNVFVNTLEKVTKEIYKRFKDSVPMIFDETAKSFTIVKIIVIHAVKSLALRNEV